MTSCIARARPACRQRGAALLTAMIIVTLVATLATAMIWQQWRAVQVESAERARVQSAWILAGALDFAGLILKETVKPNKPTTLSDPWATPLAEARLSSFLAADKAAADDGPEAFLSGDIGDAQARYNLNNLVVPKATPEQTQREIETLQRLCQAVGIESSVALRIATGLHDATGSPTGAGVSAAAPLQPATVAQLAWLGVDDRSLHALQPYVVLLPAGTPVNVNTASKEVLAAVTGLDLATAESLVQQRQRTPFASVTLFNSTTPGAPADARLAVRTKYFAGRGRLPTADRVLVERSLVELVAPTNVIKVLHRERESSLDTGS
jgi:general secretion pathway protein K